jgi:hypothetical protein
MSSSSAPPARQPTSSSSAPPARQAKPPPNTTQTGKKQGRAATVSTTEKVVHKTKKILEPSLRSLPKRAYDRTPEENKAIVDAEVKAFLVPKVPEAKPTYTQKTEDIGYRYAYYRAPI